MSSPTPSAPVELCPFCFRVMVDLAEFRAQDNVAGLSGDVGGFGAPGCGLLGLAMAALDLLLSLVGAAGRQARLDRVLRDYPYSLYCAGCGHVERRRFPPEGPA